MDLGLKDKTIIITGSGRSIGAEIADTFSKEGSIIVIADINLDNAYNVKNEIEKNGGRAIALKVDTSKKEQIENLVK